MNYVALYRKYRPAKFQEVVGQNIIIDILKSSIINEKIGHAYLFSGPRGTGKTSVAKIFARSVNCLNPVDGEACGKCEVCKKLKENDIDIIEIDAASNNGVEEIREIRNNVKLSPSFCKYKVYIIDEVHMLSSGAFNALLKTLEEPPEHVIFILATTEIQKIPLTILSRCQRFDFKKISPKILENQIKLIAKKEKKEIDEEAYSLISTISDGGMRDAINLFDQVTSLSEKKITKNDIYQLSGEMPAEQIEQMFDNAINKNIKDGLEFINNIYNEGRNFINIVDRLLLFVRDITIHNNIHNYFDEEYEKSLGKYSSLSNEKCKEITNILVELSNELKKTTNQKIIFEIYYINILNCLSNEETQQVPEVHENQNKSEELKDKVKEEKVIQNEKKEPNNYEKIKKIRIHNTLALATKQDLKEIFDKFDDVTEYISSKTYNALVKILMESKIVAASADHLVFETPSDVVNNSFKSNTNSIEKFLKKVFKINYRVVPLTSKEWDKEKQEYILNKNQGIKYELIEESDDLVEEEQQAKTKTESEAINIFGKEKINVK